MTRDHWDAETCLESQVEWKSDSAEIFTCVNRKFLVLETPYSQAEAVQASLSGPYIYM
jgi:hypothetical protein